MYSIVQVKDKNWKFLYERIETNDWTTPELKHKLSAHILIPTL